MALAVELPSQAPTLEDAAELVDPVESAHAAGLRYVSDLLKAISQLAYYGSDGVLVRLGYDPEANLARARALREQSA